MTVSNDFDRMLSSWLESAGPADADAAVVATAFASARRVRQRRGPVAWIVGPGAWPAYGRRLSFAGFAPAVRLGLVAALVLATLAVLAGALLVGSGLLSDANPAGRIVVWHAHQGGAGVINVLTSSKDPVSITAETPAWDGCQPVVPGSDAILIRAPRFSPYLYSLYPFDGGDPLDLIDTIPPAYAGTEIVSADGRFIAQVDLSGRVIATSLADPTTPLTTEHKVPGLRGAGWTGDGRLVVASIDGPSLTLTIIDPVTDVRTQVGSPLHVVPEPAGDGQQRIVRIFVSPNGRRLALSLATTVDLNGQSDTVGIVDIATGALQIFPTGFPTELLYANVAWSPDDQHLAVVRPIDLDAPAASLPATVDVVQLEGGSAILITGPTDSVVPRWSPDGSHIGFVDKGTAVIVSADGATINQIESSRTVADLAWAPTGRSLATVSEALAPGALLEFWAVDDAGRATLTRQLDLTSTAPVSGQPFIGCIAWQPITSGP